MDVLHPSPVWSADSLTTNFLSPLFKAGNLINIRVETLESENLGPMKPSLKFNVANEKFRKYKTSNTNLGNNEDYGLYFMIT